MDTQFDQYIANKSQNGVWGDDIELQAFREIYDVPIEIYAYSNRPMKTFHDGSIAKVFFNIVYAYSDTSLFSFIKIFPILASTSSEQLGF